VNKLISLIQATLIGSAVVAAYTVGWLILIPVIVIGVIYMVILEDKNS